MNESSKILVLGIYRQTITVIRSLAKAGLPIVVGRSGGKEFTEYSRYATELWVHPAIVEDEEEFITQLQTFLDERKDVKFIYPVEESDVACLERYRDKFPSSVKVIMTDKDTFFTCLDKEAMYKLCSATEVPIPETKAVYSLNDLREHAETLGFPVIVKPNDGHKFFFDNKAFICRSRQELEDLMPVWPVGNEFLVLQKFIGGYRHNCHFYAVDGIIEAYFEHKTIRTDRVNGTGRGVDNITVKPSPLLQHHCSNLIKKLGYTGVGCVQFLVSNDGQGFFLELNPRLDANCAIPYRCGYDFPMFAFELARGEYKLAKRPPGDYRSGKRGYWFMGDIYGLDDEIKRGNVTKKNILQWILKTLRSLILADLHITWWWRDPIPTFFLFYRLCSHSRKRFGEVFRQVGHP